MKKKLLTVIVPCFQRKEGILRLLQSIDFEKMDVVLVDDGSASVEAQNNKDQDLVRYLYELKKVFPSIQIVCKEHSGTAKTRVYGTNFVNTPYFCFADSDDAVRSNGLSFLVNQMQQNNCDIGLGRFQFHMGKFSFPSKCKWTQGNHSFQEDLDLGRVLNILPNKVFSSDMISCFQEIPIQAPVYEDVLPAFFLGAFSSNAFITDQILYDYYYHSDVTSSFSYYANPSSSIGVKSLYQLYMEGYQYGYCHQLFPKHLEAYESLFLRLFLQRIKAVFHYKKFHADEKDLLAKDILELLGILIPDWKNHPDFLNYFQKCEWNDVYNSFLAYQYIKRKDYYQKEPELVSPAEAYQQYCTDLDNIRAKIL